MRRVGKGCSGVETPLIEGMIVAQQVGEGAAEVNVEDVPATGVTDEGAASVNDDEVPATVDEPSITSPTPSTQPPPTIQDIPSTSQGRITADMDGDKDVTLKDVAAVAKDVQDAEIEESSDDVDIELAELKEVVEVVTTAKLITKDEAYARELEAELNKNIDWDEVIDHVQRKEKEDNVVKRKAAKKQKLDEEVAELKRHLHIVPNDDDDVYTVATHLARKVPVVDYEIYTENNKPYYKIIRADGSP
nr:hypothetical protein [Tanacetum cinerariifolium]